MDLGWRHALSCYAFIGVPLKIAEQFYTSNGLPLNFDRERLGKNEYTLRDGDAAHSYYIEQGYTTIQLNFEREPRFYAFLGFDGGRRRAVANRVLLRGTIPKRCTPTEIA